MGPGSGNVEQAHSAFKEKDRCVSFGDRLWLVILVLHVARRLILDVASQGPSWAIQLTVTTKLWAATHQLLSSNPKDKNASGRLVANWEKSNLRKMWCFPKFGFFASKTNDKQAQVEVNHRTGLMN